MRCVALAQGFKNYSLESLFIIKDFEQKFIDNLVELNDFYIKRIPKESNFIDDARYTLDIARKNNAHVIITDLSNMDSMANILEYQKYLYNLKEGCKHTVIIDGITNDCICSKMLIPSDIVISPYYQAEKKKFILNKKTKYLLGVKYFIFRKEFSEAIKKKKIIKKNASNVLVSMGGSDPFNITPKIISSLIKINRSDLKVKVAIGAGFDLKNIFEVENIIKNYVNNYELVINCNNIPELLVWADLAIIASGLTVYESTLIGTPSCVISQYEFHEEIVNNFAKAGSIISLGSGKELLDDFKVAQKINEILNNYILRKEMSRKGHKIIDAKGIDRIISIIRKESNL